MGTSDNESDQASPLKVSGHETTKGCDNQQHSSAADELRVQTSSKELNFSLSSASFSPSSSSPDSPLVEHPFWEDNSEPDKASLSPTTPSQVKQDGDLDFGNSKEEHDNSPISPTTLPHVKVDDDLDSKSSKEKHESVNDEVHLSTFSPDANSASGSSSDGEVTTVSPPTQVMERMPDSKYRIPSSVFARSKSNSPVDWSVASNDSLFSIQMGNMSFIKDDSFWKSGELGLKSGELGMKSGQLDMKSGELGMKSGELGTKPSEHEIKSGELSTPAEPPNSAHMFSYSHIPDAVVTDPRKSVELGVAVETMKEVLRECADDHKYEKITSEGRLIRHSDGSTSTKSFAFSGGADNSLKVGSSKGRRDQEKSLHKAQSLQSQPKAKQEAKSPAAALDAVAKSTGWFSCLSCRLFCCR